MAPCSGLCIHMSPGLILGDTNSLWIVSESRSGVQKHNGVLPKVYFILNWTLMCPSNHPVSEANHFSSHHFKVPLFKTLCSHPSFGFHRASCSWSLPPYLAGTGSKRNREPVKNTISCYWLEMEFLKSSCTCSTSNPIQNMWVDNITIRKDYNRTSLRCKY